MREYPVRVALVNNPKTPLEIVVRLIPLLQSRDLKALSRSREVPTVVSRVARQLHLKRSRAC